MAYRTIREIAAADVILRHQGLRRRRALASLPFGVVDLIFWPQPRAGVAVTVEAEFHRESRGLVTQWHAVHGPVAARAANAFGDMNAMIEIDVVRQARVS
jgi:hypothetical protein